MVFGLSPGLPGAVAPPAAGLAEAVMKAMFLAKLKIGAVALAAVAAVAGVGVGLLPASGAGVPTVSALQADDPNAPQPADEVQRLRAEVRRLKAELDRREVQLRQTERRLTDALDRLEKLEGEGIGKDALPPGGSTLPLTPAPGTPGGAAPSAGALPGRGAPGMSGMPGMPGMSRPGGQPGMGPGNGMPGMPGMGRPGGRGSMPGMPMPGGGEGDVTGRLDRLERGLDALMKQVESLRRELRPPTGGSPQSK